MPGRWTSLPPKCEPMTPLAHLSVWTAAPTLHTELMHDSRTHANVTGLAIPQLASFLIFSFSRLLLISSTLPTPSNHMALFPPPPAVLVLITVPSPKHVVFTLFFRTYTNVTFHLDFVLIYRQAHTPLPLSAIFLALSFVLRGIFSPCNMLSTYFIFFCTF